MEMLEMALLASTPYGEFGRRGWWDPEAWAGHLSGHGNQDVPCLAEGTVSEPLSLLSKPSSSFFWKLSSWKILEHYKATEDRRDKVTTE